MQAVLISTVISLSQSMESFQLVLMRPSCISDEVRVNVNASQYTPRPDQQFGGHESNDQMLVMVALLAFVQLLTSWISVVDVALAQ